ncbi:hypothetical protein HDV06_005710 [Boothiomyces sp. JEL0866]|nr:hypothetical protein HDV06_005710 [Boothiomyces sp. JEL0866]
MSVFQSIWTTEDCTGIPDALVAYNASLGPIYVYNYELVGYCGLDVVASPAGDGCCVSSLDLVATDGIVSWLATSIGDDWTFETSAHRSANGQTYCTIQSTDVMFTVGNDSVWYQTDEAYIRNTGDCIYGMKCTNSILNVYQELECKTLVESLSVAPTQAINYTSLTFGNISLSTTTFTNAKNYINWVSYAPGIEVVAGTKTAGDIICLTFYAVALLISLGVFLYYCWGAYRRKESILILFVFGLSFLRTIGLIVYNYYVFPDNLSFTATALAIDLSKVSMSLGNAISCMMLNKILNFQTQWFNYMPYIAVAMIYIGLQSLDIYIDVIQYLETAYVNYGYYTMISHFASICSNAYTVVVFIFDLTPIITLFTKLVFVQLKKKDKEFDTKTLLLKYWKILVIFSCQIALGLTFFIVHSLAHSTTFLGNDKIALAVSGVYILIQNLHAFIIIILYEYLRYFTWDLIKVPEEKPKEKPRMLLAEIYNDKQKEKESGTMIATVRM